MFKTKKQEKIVNTSKKDFHLLHITDRERYNERFDFLNKIVFLLLIALIFIVVGTGFYFISSYKDRFYLFKDDSIHRVTDSKYISESYSTAVANNLLMINPANAKDRLVKAYSQTLDGSKARDKMNAFIHGGYFNTTVNMRINRIFNIKGIDTEKSNRTNGYVHTIKGIQSDINDQGTQNMNVEISFETTYVGHDYIDEKKEGLTVFVYEELGYRINDFKIERSKNE